MKLPQLSTFPSKKRRIKTTDRPSWLAMDHQSKFNPEHAINFEWLEVNGLGGFASSTIIGMNTRRYHGLLTAAFNPPDGRCTLLSKLEEDLIVDGRRVSLATNQYLNAIHPQGYQYLERFELKPFPVWTYKIGDIELQKFIFMVHGQNSVAVQYKLVNQYPLKKSIHLEIRPLTAFRGYHDTAHENPYVNSKIQKFEKYFTFKPYADLPELFFAHDAASVEARGYWYKDFHYLMEQQRGLDDREDLYNPCSLVYDLSRSSSASLIVSLQKQEITNIEQMKQVEISRREDLVKSVPAKDFLNRQLTLAADQFIVARGQQKTIIAGYHWFGDWGRDTMIALPGLTLATGRYKDAKNILLEFANHVDQGMLPNRFVDAGEKPEYNSVDAALWFFEAIRQFGEYTQEWQFIKKNFYDVLKDIIHWYSKGTRYNIHMDEDGLIYCGQEGVQLTWMDAKVGNWVVTPRRGKSVEIQALWYNALCIMQKFAQRFEDSKAAKFYEELAQKAKASFNKIFWNESQGGLYDVIDGDRRVDSIRPNQIFAISLNFSILEEDKFLKVLKLAEEELWTPVGLRSLSPRHPDYRKYYTGDSVSRDGSYHQGTVWPWLIGPFIDAYKKVHGANEQTKNKIQEFIKSFEEHMKSAGLGQISEIFDADAPHAPKGCIAQAWSVAELLRVVTRK